MARPVKRTDFEKFLHTLGWVFYSGKDSLYTLWKIEGANFDFWLRDGEWRAITKNNQNYLGEGKTLRDLRSFLWHIGLLRIHSLVWRGFKQVWRDFWSGAFWLTILGFVLAALSGLVLIFAKHYPRTVGSVLVVIACCTAGLVVRKLFNMNERWLSQERP